MLFEEITLLKYFYLAVITKHNVKFTQVPKSHPLSLSAHGCYKMLLNHIHDNVTHDCIDREREQSSECLPTIIMALKKEQNMCLYTRLYIHLELNYD